MTQYNTLNVKLCNSKLNKLKSGTKSGTQVTLKLSSNVICDSYNEVNFSHKLLLTDTQVSKFRKAFANGSSANIKFSKTQLSKMIHSGGFLGTLLKGLTHAAYLAGIKALKRGVKEGATMGNNAAPALAEKATEYYFNKGIVELNKNLQQVKVQE